MAVETHNPDRQAVARLVVAAQAGDHAAFDALCHEAAQQRWLVIISLNLPTRLRAKVDPDDILQETLTRAWHGLGSLQRQDGPAFYRWVGGIARHVTADTVRRYRQAKRDAQREQGAVPVADSRILGTSHTPSRSVVRRESTDRLVALLSELKESYRAVLLYRYYEGLSRRETAELIGISEEHVSVLMFRALNKLRQLVEARGLQSTILHIG